MRLPLPLPSPLHPLLPLVALAVAAGGMPPLAAADLKPDFHLAATPENTVMFFAAANPPILHVKSGQVVEIDTLCLFGMTNDHPEQFFIDNHIPLDSQIAREMLAMKKWTMAAPAIGTTMTGPIYIDGAVPGDTLEVRVLDIKSRSDFGVNQNRPGAGGIPDLVPRPYSKVVKLDLERNIALFSDSIEVPLHQFQGRMAVSPLPAKGKLPSGPPYPDIGGNLDNKYLGKGATIYFPVQVPGALFQTGDPHAVQANGEVGQSALESANTVTMQFILRKDMPIKRVEAETATQYILMGMSKDLNVAAHDAVANSVEFLQKRKGLTFFDSMTLSTMSVDFEVTEIVDGTKGIHSLIPKSIFKDYNPADYWYQGKSSYAAVP